MSQHNAKVYTALGVACIALALSARTMVRGSSEATATGSNACVDQEARDQLDKLRRALAERDALVGQLARAANAPGETAAAAGPSQPPSTPPDQGPRRYVHFEVPNPAVSVTQKDDGTYDIRTTDPSLAGSVMQVTAVTQSGQEDQVLVRIPQ
jgi:hypothetical protein